MAPGPATRRRSNSSTGAASPRPGNGNGNGNGSGASTRASSRPKRRGRGRGRGLPLAARSPSTSVEERGDEKEEIEEELGNVLSASFPSPDQAPSSTTQSDRSPKSPRSLMRSTSNASSKKGSASASVLLALLPNSEGKSSKVQLSIKLSGVIFDPTVPYAELPLGHDGNTFYCQGCGGVGDVVCCDGCPHVYHRNCVPEGISRHSLEHDDDPWFCPECVVVPQKVCFECNQQGVDLKQCQSCEGWIHFPSCHPDDDDFEESDEESPRKFHKIDPGRILCRICRVEELEIASQDSVSVAKSPPTRAKRTVSTRKKQERANNNNNNNNNNNSNDNGQEEEEDDDNDDDHHDDGDGENHNQNAESMSKNDSGDEDDASKADSNADGDDNEDADTSKMDVDEESNNPNNPDEAHSATGKKTLNSKKKYLPRRNTRKGSIDSNANDSEPTVEPVATKKRSRPSLPSSKVKENMEIAAEESSFITPTKTKKTKNNKKRKKKLDKAAPSSPASNAKQGEEHDTDSMASSHELSLSGAHPRATPAFFFFLNENRLKIERSLSRRHRIFNRLPKGYERNELVAKEGAIWWTKLRDSEIRRYMTMSMRDFEQRVIEWKEEKNIRDMLLDDTEMDGNDDNFDSSLDDEVLTYENHQRLYLGTTVGSKPFKPEPGTSHNRVLLELLQDMRFHPMPMVVANRSDVEYGQMDFDRITIPYFDVHGPFSTSVGDECLGCTRGWTHFCNVLKRRIPAVEHRAKLQPPLSSLVATRVGLGLRPRAVDLPEENETEESAKNLPLFATREIPDVIVAKKLPGVACDSLSDPSSRADDIVQFIEETISMKVPEPPRPDFPGRLNNDSATKKGAMGARTTLPLRRTTGQKRAYDTLGGNDDYRKESLNKCGRCRTVISTDTGCIQCRRAQLVINMSKRGPSTEASPKNGKASEKGTASAIPIASIVSGSLSSQTAKSNLKVQTFMCGRLNIKDGTGEVQSETDMAIANGILRQRWIPFTILPPHTIDSPTPKSKLANRPRESRIEEQSDGATGDMIALKQQPEKDEKVDDQGDDASVSSRSKDESMDVDDDASSTDPSTAEGRNSNKRLRSARIAAGTMSTLQVDLLDDDHRQELAIRYKEDADELHKRCLGVACCGILLALMRRDPLLLFASPVTAEGYNSIIKDPMDFGKIRRNVLDNQYGTLGSFVSDCRLLCTNALAYNPPGSIYWKTAKELYDVLLIMQRRVSNWMTAVKDAHAMAWRKARNSRVTPKEAVGDDRVTISDIVVEDPFAELRKKWPEAVEMLEDSEWLRRCIGADFMRTRENETAYYGALAVRRTAAASEAALAAYPDSGGIYNPVSRRTYMEDEALRRAIDERVAEITHPVELKDLPSWREEAIIRVLRRAQSRRLDGMTGSNNGCARCDGNPSDPELKRSKPNQPSFLMRNKRKNNEVSRIDPSRIHLSTGMASKLTRDRIQGIVNELSHEKDPIQRAKAANEVAVSVRGSGIHGWGLFADQYFKKGDVVAEYIGEYVSLAVTEAREKMYQDQRIQDYQFRVDDQLVIDATMRGGHGRYINHNCSPNCIAKIIPGAAPNEHLKRVIIIAQREIEPREELTYDYQFPLELDLEARIPCNCMSEQCRGFMNWDLPEKGSNTQVFRAQKRGANMRDRIRRLGRPLKSDKGDDDEDED